MQKEIINLAPDEVLADDAYARIKSDLDALDVDRLLQINLDIPTAAKTVLGALPKIKALRERMAELPSVNVAEIDKLEDYVLGLFYVQSRYVMATRPPDDLEELYASALALRTRLVSDASNLSVHGMFDARKLAALKGSIGYRNVGVDLQSLSLALEAVWPQVGAKCINTLEDLRAASQMGTRLLRVSGVRDHAPVVLASLVEERKRAFTKVIKVWNEVRAVVAFLRRHQDDADSIAPNLYTGRAERPETPEPAKEVVEPNDSSSDSDSVAEPDAAVASPSTPSLTARTSASDDAAPADPSLPLSTAEIRRRGPFIS